MSAVPEWDAGLLVLGGLPIGLELGHIIWKKIIGSLDVFVMLVQGRLIGIGIYD
jgi:hypothetical protein